ncbi:MAG TPA: hypothetical protein VM098_09800, partial [Phycisphaerae bacterium]|nr:hypothetical protein [Phycisphaerae bacterium]
PKSACYLVDTQSGKVSNVADLLGQDGKQKDLMIDEATPSPDGKHLLVHGVIMRPGGGQRVWMAKPADGNAKQIAKGMMIRAVWVGGKAAISEVEMRGTVKRIGLFDPASGKTEPTKIYGLVASADANGQVMVVACNADDPTKPFSMRDRKEGDAVTMTPQGKVLGKLKDMGTPPLFSPNGKLLTYQVNVWAPGGPAAGPPKETRMDVMSVRGTDVRKINKQGMPMHVGDDGSLYALIFPGGLEGQPLVRFDAKGNATTIVKAARAAGAGGGRLFCVTGKDKNVLKAVPLPK